MVVEVVATVAGKASCHNDRNNNDCNSKEGVCVCVRYPS